MQQPAYFEGDLVLRHGQLMVVLASDEAGALATCVWYEGLRRCVAAYPHAQLELLSGSVLRPGHRLVRSPGGDRSA